MASAGTLQHRWYEARPPAWWTLPVAALYAGAGSLRRGLYRHGLMGVQRLPVPVVVVGNLTVGGTGKTPLVIALVEALRARGLAAGVVSRGYGGRAEGPLLLGPEPDPAEVGDEPALVAWRTGAPVAVGRDRPAAARLLVGEGVDVVVADDGLQHYALARDLEICVLDGTRRLGNGWQLPAGPLREPAARLGRVDFVVCNGGVPASGEVPMRLVPDALRALDGAQARPTLEAFRGRRVHAVAGIGNPGRFFQSLREAGLEVVAHAFPDHHGYVPQDLAFKDPGPVLMTEKDAVKCRRFAKPGWWAVPVQACLPDAFLDQVAACVRRTGTTKDDAPAS